MKDKTVADSKVELLRLMMPSDANPSGYVFGGTILKIIDEVAGLVAHRHARTNVVTASIERTSFWEPVYIGDVLKCIASLNYVGHTSMIIGVRIEAEDPNTGRTRHVGTSYVTAVALNKKGSPSKVPRLMLITEEEKKRWKRAEEARKRMKEHIKEEHNKR